VLIVAGIALLAVGLVRSSSQEGGGGPPEEPAATLPSVPTQTQPPEPSEPPSGASVALRLDRRVIEGLFAIGVPRGWRAGREGSGLEIESAGSVARVEVLIERGERGLLVLARGAAAILSDETGGARVKRAGRVMVGGARGLRLTSDDGSGLVVRDRARRRRGLVPVADQRGSRRLRQGRGRGPGRHPQLQGALAALLKTFHRK